VVVPDNLDEKNSENPKPSSTNNSDSETSKDAERGKDGKLLVRGREFNQKKPETFNQLWTPEEQKRLEELLVIYPPEQIEMERFRKIARALGNRTPLQVQSRVQKYFIKLQKAGLPVPGRTYNFTQYSNNRKVPYFFKSNYCNIYCINVMTWFYKSPSRVATAINETIGFSFHLPLFLHQQLLQYT
jgi:hypothetical protein